MARERGAVGHGMKLGFDFEVPRFRVDGVGGSKKRLEMYSDFGTPNGDGLNVSWLTIRDIGRLGGDVPALLGAQLFENAAISCRSRVRASPAP
jgi:hypothetical protein